MNSQDPNPMHPISNITDRISAIDLSVDDDFTFAVSFPAISDDIAPAFPLFNRELLSDLNPNPIELRSGSTSSSSSSSSIESDEGSYCVWNEDRERKKSASTGSGRGVEPESKWRWTKVLEQRRSVSDGKDKFGKIKDVLGKNGKKNEGKEMDLVTAHKLFYGKETKKEKKTFLPYKKQLVGLW